MSEPTIRLPLHRGIGNECRYVFEADGEELCAVRGPNSAAALVSLVNSQAERIRGLEEALRGLAKYGLGEHLCWCSPTALPHSPGCRGARAALDKAGKEGE